jgi:oligosaccharide repeat unit polymerase
VIALTAALIILTGVFLSASLWRSVLTPLGVYSGVWSITLIASAAAPLFGIVLYPVSEGVWLTIIFGWVFFLAGCVAAAGFAPNSTKLRIVTIARPRRLRRTVAKTVALGSLGVSVKWILLVRRFGGFSSAINNIGIVKVTSIATGERAYPAILDVLVFFLFLAVAFTAVGLANGIRSFRKWIIFEIALLVLNDFAFASRGTSVDAILLACLVYATELPRQARRFRLRTFVIGIVSVFSFLIVLEAAHAVREGIQFDSAKYVSNALLNPYFYLVGPLPAWSKIRVSRLGNGYPVAYALGGFYRGLDVCASVVGISFGWKTPPKPYVRIPMEFNTYPQLCLLEADFGIVGAQAVMFILGLWFTAVHQVCIHRRTVMTVIVEALLLTYLVITPRDIMSFWMSFWFLLTAGPLLAYRLDRSAAERETQG